ncbi:MAG: ATP-binding protein [Chloroflexales bacterium]|nr:ATP-binding protein [Chloroflexales bacterium]
MIHSLRLRLLLILVAVVVVAVGTVAFLVNMATRVDFIQYVERNTEREQDITMLLNSYHSNQRTDEVQLLVEQVAREFGDRLILVDSDRSVIADSASDLNGQHLDDHMPLAAMIVFTEAPSELDAALAAPLTVPLTATDGVIRYRAEGPIPRIDLYRQDSAIPVPATGFFVAGLPAGAIEKDFLASITRSLFVAAGVAILVGVLLNLALSRDVLRPIEALTGAARKMEQGDLGQRVHVQTRDEIGALAHAFNAMADGVQRIEQLRRNMVTDVAHELRTPLTNLRGYLEAVRDGIAPPNPELIDLLYEEVLLLNRLIDDLQDVALVEASQLRLVRQPVALAALIDRAVQALRPRVTDAGLELDLWFPPNLPLVDADAERVSQVVRNLISNAITHTLPGGSITIVAHLAGAHVEVSVRDTGSGIAPKHLPYVFERFYRVDPSRARTTGGVGLGLFIVKQLVEAHGGKVWAESAPGAGSLFCFTLPVAP